MKFTVSQSDLSSKLSLVSKAIPSRPTHPILANILLTAKDEKLTLTGSDLSITITTSLDAQVSADGSITAPAKLFSDIISKMPAGDLEIETEESRLTITSSLGGKYQIMGMEAAEYPEIPQMEDSQILELSTATLLDGFKGTLFSASHDETKQVLTGLNIKIAGTGIAFAATDGHRLAVVHSDGEAEAIDAGVDVTIPVYALREVERVLGEGDSIKLLIDSNQCQFDTGTTQITSRRLEGQYPNYPQLIPKQFTNKVTLDRKKFLSALERIGILASQKNNIIVCELNMLLQELSLSVEAADVGSGREGVPVVQMDNQEPGTISFNAKYLTEALKLIPSQEVQLRLNNSLNPVILVPVGEAKWEYLVMPVQTRK